ncbi:MAG: hypothetical protein HY530_07055 [Chloroflexi bacterium]|nr:hypothetical protein [Chloroflexota bacterium]
MAWETKFPEDSDTQYPPEEYRPDKFHYPWPGHKVLVTVERVYGCCPVTVEGDRMMFSDVASPVFDECDISSDSPLFLGSTVKGTRTGTLCTVALKAIYPYIIAMDYGVSAVDLGIAESGEDGFIVCAAWGPPNCEAQVIFRLHPIPVEKCGTDMLYEYLAQAGHVGVPSYYLETFASDATKEERKRKIEEWKKAGKPKFWEGWRNPPCQPRRKDA